MDDLDKVAMIESMVDDLVEDFGGNDEESEQYYSDLTGLPFDFIEDIWERVFMS